MEALLYPNSTCALLSYSDIRGNVVHMETHEDNKKEFLLFQRIFEEAKRHLKMCPLSNLDCTAQKFKP